MNPIELLTEACAQTERQLEVGRARPEAATGCSEWNVSQLANHMVVALEMWADILSGITPAHDPFDPPHVLGDDMVADFRAAADRAIAAFSVDGALDQVVTTPAGEMPGAAAINFPTYDVYVHGWDLERATGVVGEHPAELTELAMGFAQQAFADGRPPHIVGPALEIGADAPAFDKMLAYNGRQP